VGSAGKRQADLCADLSGSDLPASISSDLNQAAPLWEWIEYCWGMNASSHLDFGEGSSYSSNDQHAEF
jgi:hypothetical protein